MGCVFLWIVSHSLLTPPFKLIPPFVFVRSQLDVVAGLILGLTLNILYLAFFAFLTFFRRGTKDGCGYLMGFPKHL